MTIMLFVLYGNVLSAQYVHLTSQNDVDSFPINYPGQDTVNRVIIGYTTISDISTDIVNLDSLRQIKYIQGELIISENDSLESLSGLDSLSEISYYFRVSRNGRLRSIENLISLDSVGYFISIAYNDSLTSCAVDFICKKMKDDPVNIYIQENSLGCDGPDELLDFCNLQCDCPPGINFSSQEKLDSFPIKFPDCTHIVGNVNISGDYIHNLDSLLQVELIEGSLNILSGTNLEDLEGLDSLKSVSGDIHLYENDKIQDLKGLQALVNCGGSFRALYNDKLTSFASLEKLEHVGESLQLYGNARLKYLTGLESLRDVGNLSISGNDSLIDLSGLSSLDTIRGDVGLYGNFMVQDYTGLNSLEWVGGRFGSDIPQLSGLESLTTIGKELWLQDVEITNFMAIDNLDSLGGLTIQYCTLLEDFQGLENVNSLPIGFICEGNSSLMSLEGLNGLREVNEISINHNSNLASLSGLDSLDKVLWSLEIIGNTGLHELSGLNNLSFVGGDLNIVFNTVLHHIQDLSVVNYIGGDLYLGFNSNLVDLQGLESLEGIGGNFYIESSNSLKSFTGVGNLKSIDGDFIITKNNALLKINDLRIDSIQGSLYIYSNPNLLSVSGFDSTLFIGDNIRVYNNESLSTCEVRSFCNFIATHPDEDHYFSGNQIGCNSAVEVMARCRSCPCQLTEQNIWIGASDNKWHTPYNWSQLRVPSVCDVVSIEESHIPIILESNRTAECYSLFVSNGIEFTQEIGAIMMVGCSENVNNDKN